MLKKDILKILNKGVYIFSSGTTDVRKKIFRTPENLLYCLGVALKEQEIDSNSSIFTVTKLDHAGGLLAQTLPGLYVGANVQIENHFKPYSFLKKFKDHTHTFLPPRYIKILIKTKGFEDYDFQNKRILTGSDPIDWNLIEALVAQNATVQTNWGMSEIGPITIYSLFKTQKDIERFKKKTPKNHKILGNIFCTYYKIIEGELFVKSKQCIYKDWFATKDLVTLQDGVLFYKGRKNARNKKN